MKGLRGAVTFLTRFPAGSGPVGEEELARSARWFPVVGALVGVVVGATYALIGLWLPSLVAALIAVLVGVVVTGGLHEDGLGDVADAFGGGTDAADIARILKDPRQGTFGVIAITGALVLRAVALGSMSPTNGLAMAVAAHAIGRTAAVVAMRAFRPAGQGLAATFARSLTTVDVVVAVALGIAIGAIASGVWVAASLAIALVAAGIIGRFGVKKLGGLTGDLLGAIEQVAETAILVLGTAIMHEAWLAPAWWA